MKFGVTSDLHAHKWSNYSYALSNGVNSRLQLILDELARAGQAVLDAGGRVLVIAGDVFHVRGAVDPEVLNPTQSAVRKLLDKGLEIHVIPGNHDLAGAETTALGSSVQTLSETFSMEGTIFVHNEPSHVVIEDTAFTFVPWASTTAKLLDDIKAARTKLVAAGIKPSEAVLFIHAGIDGVLPHMPDHGLTAKTLAEFGFRNVFSGHYHNHKDLGDGVYSIGASTHQTWGDIDTRAGFLLCDSDGSVEFHASHAPSFVDVSGLEEEEIALQAAGNYARFRGERMSPQDVKDLRTFLEECGARGVSIQVAKMPTTERAGRPASSGKSLDESVSTFIDENKELPSFIDRDLLKRDCAEVLSETRSVFEES